MVVGYTKGTWESLKCMHHLVLSSRNSLFPFPSPGGLGLEGKLALTFLLQWDGRGSGDSFAGSTCRLSSFVWCSYVMNGLHRVLGGDGDGG